MRLRSEWLDVTLPSRERRQGTIHPVSQVSDEIAAIFADMGFSVAEGPQIESDWYNFDALNIPAEHPTRTEMDTFYMARAEGDNRPPHVLRTHTSPVQIRTMLEQEPPVRIISPGRCFRRDTTDATHSASFTQVEGQIVLAALPGWMKMSAMLVLKYLFDWPMRFRTRPNKKQRPAAR